MALSGPSVELFKTGAALADCITGRFERFRAPKPEGGVAEFAWSMELPPPESPGE